MDESIRIPVSLLLTDVDGLARFHVFDMALDGGSAQARLSELMSSGGCQWRTSPVGFSNDFHCTETPQWLVVLQGAMEIGLRDGSSRVFGPGEFFYSADVLAAGEVFDPSRHGHRSRQVGAEPLMTLFIRCDWPFD